ncbi:hypothetical protein [Absicoccus porci]|uniref:hypothetical protein n=1 Tax=Absicoccus porci TaxID=2486576 RepID=UPI002943D2B9|nr:hypothetical protein [Absicoccus porci]
MDDRRRHYVIIYEQKFGHETLQDEYTKFCTFEELLESVEALYSDPCVTSVMYYEITEAA